MNAIHYLTRLTRRVSLVEQELLILPEHLTLFPVFSGLVLIDLYFFVQRFVDSFVLLCFFLLPLCCRLMDSDYHIGFVTFPSELTPFIILTVYPGPLWVLVKVAQALRAP